jgi:hypothetical protein
MHKVFSLLKGFKFYNFHVVSSQDVEVQGNDSLSYDSEDSNNSVGCGLGYGYTSGGGCGCIYSTGDGKLNTTFLAIEKAI